MCPWSLWGFKPNILDSWKEKYVDEIAICIEQGYQRVTKIWRVCALAVLKNSHSFDFWLN